MQSFELGARQVKSTPLFCLDQCRSPVIGLSLPSIIDYSTVLQTLDASGLRCVYPNSGAFGLPADAESHFVGWLAVDDPTIRPEMRSAVRIVPPPAARSLAESLRRIWQEHFRGPLWLMPASHWAYELQFGHADWLPALLGQHGVDPALLRSRSDGSAIEFQLDEADSLLTMVENLFERLVASDFTVAFPGKTVAALLHHHRQIWWQTSEMTIWKQIDSS
jgi:hypothetical protein